MKTGRICPVCGQTVFKHPNSYETCSVCLWQDDLVQTEEPDFEGGANEMSLNQAREAWKKGEKII